MAKNKITLNVLANITKKVGNVNTRNLDNNLYKDKNKYTNRKLDIQRSSDRALVVFTGSDINLGEKLDLILELKKQRVSLSLAFSNIAEKILNVDRIKESLKPEEVYLEDDILKLKEISLNYNYIISPNITMNTMSKITEGFIDGLIPNLIWTFMYLNKDVYIDFESTLNYLGMNCKNEKIEDIILGQIKGVKDMGVTELSSSNYIDTIYKNRNVSDRLDNSLYNNNSYNITSNRFNRATYNHRNLLNGFGEFTSKQNRGNYNLGENPIRNNSAKKKVYTQNDINDSLVQNGNLIIEKGSILTPLAKDRIKSMGITIKFE